MGEAGREGGERERDEERERERYDPVHEEMVHSEILYCFNHVEEGHVMHNILQKKVTEGMCWFALEGICLFTPRDILLWVGRGRIFQPRNLSLWVRWSSPYARSTSLCNQRCS